MPVSSPQQAISLAPVCQCTRGYVSEVDQLKTFLTANGIEFVDVRTALVSDNAQSV